MAPRDFTEAYTDNLINVVAEKVRHEATSRLGKPQAQFSHERRAAEQRERERDLREESIEGEGESHVDVASLPGTKYYQALVDTIKAMPKKPSENQMIFIRNILLAALPTLYDNRTWLGEFPFLRHLVTKLTSSPQVLHRPAPSPTGKSTATRSASSMATRTTRCRIWAC